MSFKAYIERRRVTDTPAGDFTKDAKADSRMPDATSWAELKSYLYSRGASDLVVEAARPVWAAYAATRRKVANA